MPVHQPLDLAATLFSGQSFRWRRQGEWSYGVLSGNLVKIRRGEDGVEFFSTPQDEPSLQPLLSDYLGLDVDLDAIYASIAPDQRIQAAIARYRGMRILRQDPWESLISFICSSASNIPRITRNVEALCTTFGRPLRLDDHVRSTFPSPHELADAGERRLLGLGLGYRAGYVAATARAIAEERVTLTALREASYEDALKALTSLAGVGDKVANCVLLFSLDKPQAFPVDVWVHRAIREWYLDGGGRARWKGYRRPSESGTISLKTIRLWAQDYFGPYAGYANQYLFHDRRLQGKAPARSGERTSPVPSRGLER